MLTALLLTAALATPSPEPVFQPTRRQLIQSASGMAKYKPAIGPMVASALLFDVVTSAGPRTAGGLGSGGLVGGDLYLADLIDLKLASTGTIQWSATTDPTATKDVGFSRPSAGLIKVTNGGSGLGAFQLGKLTITSLATPATPVITQGGAGGATAYSYKIVAKLPDATTTEAGIAGSTATGNAVLDGTNYNIITWAATTNAYCYDVWRTAGGATQGKILTCVGSPQNDTGLAGVGAGTEPTYNSTGTIGSATGGVVIGNNSTGAAAGAVSVGNTTVASGIGNAAYGSGATAGGTYSTAIGYSATTDNTGGVSVGYNSRATTGAQATAVGTAAYATAAGATSLGKNAEANATQSIAIGNTATVPATSANAIALGILATVPAASPNIMVVGGDAYPISAVYFSEGVTNASPLAWTLNGTGGSGSDIVGGALQLAPGISTGSADPARVVIRKTSPIGTGSTPQTLADLASFGDVKADGTTSFFNLSGTMPTTISGTSSGAKFSITGAGSSGSYNRALTVEYLAGYTGASQTSAIFATNASATTGGAPFSGDVTTGISSTVSGASSGDRLAVAAYATGATSGRNVGLFSYVSAGTTRVGGLSTTDGGGTTNVGMFAGFASSFPSVENAALLVDNAAVTAPIIVARDNATCVWQVADGGSVQCANSKNLTDATATAFVRTTVADDDYELLIVKYSVYAEDADTDARQVTGGIATFAILNNSGTETCALPTNYNNYIQATNVTAGTLAVTFDCNSAVNNTIDLRVTADTSLDAAAETLKIEYAVQVVSGTATVTPQ